MDQKSYSDAFDQTGFYTDEQRKEKTGNVFMLPQMSCYYKGKSPLKSHFNIYHLVTPRFNEGMSDTNDPHLSSIQNIHIKRMLMF